MADLIPPAASSGLGPAAPPIGADSAVSPRGAPLLTPTFLFTWGATFALFNSFYLLIPTIPLYASTMGATEAQIGLVIGLFEVSSTFSRPCVAPAIDRGRRKTFMVLGAALFAVTGLLYVLATTLPRLMLVRVLHGAGMGIFMTAATALITDVAPPMRRGEALGAYGLGINLAMAIAPAAGMLIVNRGSFLALFMVSTGMAAVALALAALVPSRVGAPRAETPVRRSHAIISRAALFPSAIVMAQTITYGAVLSFVPIWGRAKGIENPGIFFTLFAVGLLVLRTQAGKFSDRFGRAAVAIPGFAFLAAALVLLATAVHPWHVFAAGIVFGLGMGAIQPSLTAFLTDRVPEIERARAFATYYGSFELGIALGSVCFGWVLAATTFPVMWTIAAGVAAAGGGAFILGDRRSQRGAPPQRSMDG